MAQRKKTPKHAAAPVPEEPLIPSEPEEEWEEDQPEPVNAAAPVPPAPKRVASFLDELQERLPKGPDALKDTKLFQPRERSFDFDGAMGGYLSDGRLFFSNGAGEPIDVTITVREVGSAEEIKALNAGETPQEAPFLLAKAALYKLDGKVIPPHLKNMVWEGLGSTGRSAVIMAFGEMGGSSEAMLGKYRSTLTVG